MIHFMIKYDKTTEEQGSPNKTDSVIGGQFTTHIPPG
jgi:hypothetical protein